MCSISQKTVDFCTCMYTRREECCNGASNESGSVNWLKKKTQHDGKTKRAKKDDSLEDGIE